MNRPTTPQLAVALGLGVLFAVGLVISGMTLPSKVVGFFDFSDGTTSWDPSLGFVMAGAIAVYLPAYRLTMRRSKPALAERFRLPTSKGIDGRLIVGSALFGIGWGMSGFCPGPALASLGGMTSQALIMVGGVIVGMVLFQRLMPAPKA